MIVCALAKQGCNIILVGTLRRDGIEKSSSGKLKLEPHFSKCIIIWVELRVIFQPSSIAFTVRLYSIDSR